MEISSIIKNNNEESSVIKFQLKTILGKELILPSENLKPYQIKIKALKTKNGSIKIISQIYKLASSKKKLINTAIVITKLGKKASINQTHELGKSYEFSFKPIKIE